MNNTSIVLLTISNLFYKIAIFVALITQFTVFAIACKKKLGVCSIKTRMRYKIIGIPIIFYDFLIM